MAAPYPSWINKALFSEVLQADDKKGEIVKLELKPANNKGENYSSVMLRAILRIRKCDEDILQTYIIKLDPVGKTQEVMDQFNVFPKEIEVYQHLLPRFEKQYALVLNEDIQLSPKCLKTSLRDPENLLILDDLCSRGYRTANRLQGLNIQHAKLALGALAKFHAASAVYYQQVNKVVSKHFEYGLHADHMKPIIYEMYKKNVELLREISSTWECHQSMHSLLDNHKTKMLDQVFALLQKYRKEGRFMVLCHGDFWCNNVMFRYDSANAPQHCLLLDFQLSHYNSPAFDLNYFIFTSIQKDIRLSHIDHFLCFYHQELCSNLELLGYLETIPTLMELHRDFHDLGAYGLNAAYGTLCAVLAPPGLEEADMDSLLGDDDQSRQFRRKLFSNPLYVEALEQLIPYFARKGVF